jgi:hypothetical protein
MLRERTQVLEEQQPGRLLGVVQLTDAACVFAQDVVDVFEGLLEHALSLVVIRIRIKTRRYTVR